jgi:hypothetical protein
MIHWTQFLNPPLTGAVEQQVEGLVHSIEEAHGFVVHARTLDDEIYDQACQQYGPEKVLEAINKAALHASNGASNDRRLDLQNRIFAATFE